MPRKRDKSAVGTEEGKKKEEPGKKKEEPGLKPSTRPEDGIVSDHEPVASAIQEGAGDTSGKSAPKKTATTRKPQKGRGKKEAEDDQRQITDFFPIRRSTRKCKSVIESEKFEELAEKIRRNCEADLRIISDDVKGRGVVSTCARRKGDFVCEYAGELISHEDAKKKEKKYEEGSEGCYMYYFEHKNTKYCVDATQETNRLGRLLNHSRTKANVTTKVYEVDGCPRLCLMALTDIEPGVELLYDYGERSKEVIESHPWLTA